MSRGRLPHVVLYSTAPEVSALSDAPEIEPSSRGELARRATAVGVATLIALARVLPRRVAYAMADAAGLATLYAWPRGRRNALQNFARVLGQPERSRAVRRTARRSFSHFGRMGVDLLRHHSFDEAQLRHEIKAEGLEHIDEALRFGKGVILVAPHLGNWEAGVSLGCFVPYHAVAVADEGLLASLVAGHRARAGIDIVPRSRSLRPILRALGRNELVVLMSDLAKDMRSVSVEFFGRPSRVPSGPAQLARRTGAPLVPIYAVRDKDQMTMVRVEAPFAPIVTDNPEHDLQRMSQWMADFFARVIRRHPDQWYPYQEYWAGGVSS